VGIFKERFKGVFKGGNEKIVLALLLIIVLAVIFVYTDHNDELPALSEEQSLPTASAPQNSSEILLLEKQLEERIALNLASIQGVGKTRVMVTFSSGLKKEYAVDRTVTKKTSKETAKEGGTRETVEETESTGLVMADSVPVVVVEYHPQIAGVLVIAQGAADPKIKEEIFQAVRTLLNIQPSKISVLPLGGG